MICTSTTSKPLFFDMIRRRGVHEGSKMKASWRNVRVRTLNRCLLSWREKRLQWNENSIFQLYFSSMGKIWKSAILINIHTRLDVSKFNSNQSWEAKTSYEKYILCSVDNIFLLQKTLSENYANIKGIKNIFWLPVYSHDYRYCIEFFGQESHVNCVLNKAV